MKKKEFEFHSMWVYVSLFVYLIMRAIEYLTGVKGTPEWAVDFLPFTSLLVFFLCEFTWWYSTEEMK